VWAGVGFCHWHGADTTRRRRGRCVSGIAINLPSTSPAHPTQPSVLTGTSLTAPLIDHSASKRKGDDGGGVEPSGTTLLLNEGAGTDPFSPTCAW
jgi:hypothetical protein